MAFGQMGGWGQPMYPGFAPQAAMPDQTAQLRAQQQFNPQMGMQMTPMSAQQQAQQGAPIWVQGEAGAKSFLVAPGQTVQLMDSEAEVFYIKASDASGVPLPLRIFDYKERTTGAQRPAQAAQAPAVEYVTRTEYDALAAKLAGVVAKLDELTRMPTQRASEPAQAPKRSRHAMREEDMIDA